MQTCISALYVSVWTQSDWWAEMWFAWSLLPISLSPLSLHLPQAVCWMLGFFPLFCPSHCQEHFVFACFHFTYFAYIVNDSTVTERRMCLHACLLFILAYLTLSSNWLAGVHSFLVTRHIWWRSKWMHLYQTLDKATRLKVCSYFNRDMDSCRLACGQLMHTHFY